MMNKQFSFLLLGINLFVLILAGLGSFPACLGSGEEEKYNKVDAMLACDKLTASANREYCQILLGDGKFDKDGLYLCNFVKNEEKRLTCFEIIKDSEFKGNAINLCYMNDDVYINTCLSNIKDKNISDKDLNYCRAISDNWNKIQCLSIVSSK